MKSVLVTVLSMLNLPGLIFAQGNEMTSLRVLYYEASKSSQVAQTFYERFSAVDESSEPILLAYKGMANFMLANHTKLPTAKLAYFLEGKALLEKAIKLSPENVELRYLRFTVQTSAPHFLSYIQSINSDKEFLFVTLNTKESKIDDDLRNRILKYLVKNKYCNGKEKKKARALLAALKTEAF